MATVTCPSCAARLSIAEPAPARVSCPACGSEFAVRRLAPKVAPRRVAPVRVSPRRQEDDEPEADADEGELSRGERLAASRELGKAMRFVRALEASYVALAMVVGLWFMLSLVALGSSLWTFAFGAVVVVSIAGALRVERHPVRWSLILASAATLLLAARVLAGSVPVVLGIVVLAYWTAVSFASRIEVIVRRHPDLWLARRMRGDTVEDERGSISTKHRERARSERAARRKRRFVMAGVVVAGLVAVVFAMSRLMKHDEPYRGAVLPPPGVPATAPFARFREAWNANRLDDVKAHFLPELRAKFSRGLDRIIANHAWKPLPTLGAPRTTDEGRYASAVYGLPNGEGDLYTSWAWDDDTRSWGINALRPPKD